MRIDIMTLFPDTVNAVLHESIIGRAANKGLVEINCVQIRDYTDNRQNQVDDYPYGGGFGCVMMAQPLKACLDSILSETEGRRSRVIYMSPQGRPYNQATAKRLQADYDHLVLVCGHYEGIDERFIESCVDEEISLGDFVLTGGEIAAMAVADSVCRLVPGVLADEQCYIGESHWDGLLEYPQYTRPELWEGLRVPEVLLKGDHSKVSLWRRKQQLKRTKEKRPDMFERFELQDKTDEKLLKELHKEQSRKKLDMELSYKKAELADLPRIMEIVADARRSLAKYKVDQWQGDYPQVSDFEGDIKNGELYKLMHGDELAGFFMITECPQPSYDLISDGKWTPDISYCSVHRSAVAAEYRSSGMAEYMLKCAEECCRACGKGAIRIDTHAKNKPMQNLLRANGYRYRGNVLVEECGHDPRRHAFEKLIKDKSK